MRVLITGGLGQDGALLARKHLESSHEVHLLDHSIESKRLWRLRALGIAESPNLHMHAIANHDSASFKKLCKKIVPSRAYLLGDTSLTLDSFNRKDYNPEKLSAEILSQASLFSEISSNGWALVASSSEIYQPDGEEKSESSEFRPSSPYGRTKELVTRGADELIAGGAKIATGIFFPHESFLRSPRFVVGKISLGIGRYIATSNPVTLQLGSPDARRDWSSANKFAECMMSLGDVLYSGRAVFGSGRLLTVREVLDLIWGKSGLPPLEDRHDEHGFLTHCSSGRFTVTFNDRRFDKTASKGCSADASLVKKIAGKDPGDFDAFSESLSQAIRFHASQANQSS